MSSKITDEILFIPPFVSTRWSQIKLIETNEDDISGNFNLILHLVGGSVVELPNLDPDLINKIFLYHFKHLEKRGDSPPKKKKEAMQNIFGITPDQIASLQLPFGPNGPVGLNDGVQGFEASMQHDPKQTHMPDLPTEVIDKIAEVVKVLSNGDLKNVFPKPEPHCNCPHCQLTRAVHKEDHEKDIVEEVTEADLAFRDWEIEQAGENLYTVTNPLDSKEHYSVFLGNPVGCTCGQPHCDHIRAVLLT